MRDGSPDEPIEHVGLQEPFYVSLWIGAHAPDEFSDLRYRGPAILLVLSCWHQAQGLADVLLMNASRELGPRCRGQPVVALHYDVRLVEHEDRRAGGRHPQPR